MSVPIAGHILPNQTVAGTKIGRGLLRFIRNYCASEKSCDIASVSHGKGDRHPARDRSAANSRLIRHGGVWRRFARAQTALRGGLHEDRKMITIRTFKALFLVLSVATGLAACTGMWQEDDIDVAEVPVAAINAAKGAVPGLEIRSAEAENKDGRTIYEIDGKADGVKHEVKVTADGEVLKVKTDD